MQVGSTLMALSGALTALVQATNILLPLYLYPEPGAWDYINKVVGDNPAVTFDVILNVDSGPGGPDPGFNDDWRPATAALKAYPNVRTWGYVHAMYNASYLGDVAVNMSYWARWQLYEQGAIAVDGIFIDEVPNDDGDSSQDSADVDYVRTAVTYARRIWASYANAGSLNAAAAAAAAAAPPRIALNVGTAPRHAEYFDLADYVCVFEEFPWAYDDTVLADDVPAGRGAQSSLIVHDMALTGYNETTLQEWLSAFVQAGLGSTIVTNAGYEKYSDDEQGPATLGRVASILSQLANTSSTAT